MSTDQYSIEAADLLRRGALARPSETARRAARRLVKGGASPEFVQQALRTTRFMACRTAVKQARFATAYGASARTIREAATSQGVDGSLLDQLLEKYRKQFPGFTDMTGAPDSEGRCG